MMGSVSIDITKDRESEVFRGSGSVEVSSSATMVDDRTFLVDDNDSKYDKEIFAILTASDTTAGPDT